jgi:hypothetical protein
VPDAKRLAPVRCTGWLCDSREYHRKRVKSQALTWWLFMGAIIKPGAGSVESREKCSRGIHVLRIRLASNVRASAYIHSHSDTSDRPPLAARPLCNNNLPNFPCKPRNCKAERRFGRLAGYALACALLIQRLIASLCMHTENHAQVKMITSEINGIVSSFQAANNPTTKTAIPSHVRQSRYASRAALQYKRRRSPGGSAASSGMDSPRN